MRVPEVIRLAVTKSLKQELRENERKINKICNFLADEIKLFEERETQATQEFKLAAAKHDTLAATNGVVLKTMALNIVRVRKARAKLMLVESQMQANKTVAVTAGALQNVAMTMKSLGSTLGSLNQRLSPQAIQRLSMNFERQVGQLGVKADMLNDAMDGAAGDEAEDDEASDLMISRLMDEVGLVTQRNLDSLPVVTTRTPGIQFLPNVEAKNDRGGADGGPTGGQSIPAVTPVATRVATPVATPTELPRPGIVTGNAPFVSTPNPGLFSQIVHETKRMTVAPAVAEETVEDTHAPDEEELLGNDPAVVNDGQSSMSVSRLLGGT